MHRVGYREDRYEDGIRNDILRTTRSIGRMHHGREHGDLHESNNNNFDKWRRNIRNTKRTVLGQR